MPTAPGRPCAFPSCPVIGPCQAHDRLKVPAWKKWYQTAAWRRLRAWVLANNPLCVMCQALHVVCVATEVDHIIPHRGDRQLFWDPVNLQGLCATHHSEKTRRGE